MPVKGFLGQEPQKRLQKTLKEHEHPEIRERILILLLLNLKRNWKNTSL